MRTFNENEHKTLVKESNERRQRTLKKDKTITNQKQWNAIEK